AGELNSGCCTGEEPAIGCEAGGDVGFEMVAGAAGPCTSRLLWFFGPAKLRFTKQTDTNPKTKTKPHARMPAALTQNTFSPPLQFLFCESENYLEVVVSQKIKTANQTPRWFYFYPCRDLGGARLGQRRTGFGFNQRHVDSVDESVDIHVFTKIRISDRISGL